MKEQSSFKEICQKGGCIIDALIFEQRLRIRLLVEINKNKSFVFEGQVKHIKDLGSIAEQCQNFQQIISYMKDPSNIQIDIPNHTIQVIQRTGINKNKINVLFTIQLHETKSKRYSEIIADNIFQKCGKKGNITSEDTKQLFQMIGMCFGEVIEEMKQMKKQQSQNNQKDKKISIQQQEKKIQQRIKSENAQLQKKINKNHQQWLKKYQTKMKQINKKFTDLQTKKIDKTQVNNKIKQQIQKNSQKKANKQQIDELKKQIQKCLANQQVLMSKISKQNQTIVKQIKNEQIKHNNMQNYAELEQRIKNLQKKVVQMNSNKVESKQFQNKLIKQRNQIQKKLTEKSQKQVISLSKKIENVQNLIKNVKKDVDQHKKDIDKSKKDIDKLKQHHNSKDKNKKQKSKQNKQSPKPHLKQQIKVQNKIQQRKTQRVRTQITPEKKQNIIQKKIQQIPSAIKQQAVKTPRLKTQQSNNTIQPEKPRPKPKPKAKKVEQVPVKVIPSSINASKWVQPECHYYKQLVFKDNIIGNKLKQHVYILGKQPIIYKNKFRVAFTSLKKFASVGIIDSQYKNNFDYFGLLNIIQLWNNGASYIGGKMHQESEGFKQGDIIEILVRQEDEIIEWNIGEINIFKLKNQLIKKKQIKWVPYIYLSSQSQNVSLCD